MRDRCLRTQFISVMVAPDLSSALLISCFSASEMLRPQSQERRGAARDQRRARGSSGPRPLTLARMRAAPAMPPRPAPDASFDHSIVLARHVCCPNGDDEPSRGPSQCSSTAFAMAGRSLARANHDGAALGRSGSMLRQGRRRAEPASRRHRTRPLGCLSGIKAVIPSRDCAACLRPELDVFDELVGKPVIASWLAQGDMRRDDEIGRSAP